MILYNGRNVLCVKGYNQTTFFKAFNGTNKSFTPSYLSTATATMTLAVGSGTTAVAIDDYALANMITEGLTIVIASKSETSANRVWDSTEPLMFVNAIITNDTENDITVNEAGIMMYSTSYSTGEGDSFLLTRVVLAEPIVLGAGRSYQIRIDVE